MTPGPFPPDSDLPPGSTVVSLPLNGTYLGEGGYLKETVRVVVERYQEHSGGEPPDLVLLALPLNKGAAFCRGLAESMNAQPDPG